jgi:hypothetical protein
MLNFDERPPRPCLTAYALTNTSTMTENVLDFTQVKRRNSSGLYLLMLSYLILQRYFDYCSFARGLINNTGLLRSQFAMTVSLHPVSSLRTARVLPEAGSNRSVAELNGVNPDIAHCFIFIIHYFWVASLRLQ